LLTSSLGTQLQLEAGPTCGRKGLKKKIVVAEMYFARSRQGCALLSVRLSCCLPARQS